MIPALFIRLLFPLLLAIAWWKARWLVPLLAPGGLAWLALAKVYAPGYRVVAAGLASAAFWCVAPWFGDLAEMPLSLQVPLMALITAGGWVWFGGKEKSEPSFHWLRDIGFLLFAACLMAGYTAPLRDTLALPGDMSMNAYLSRLIVEQDGIPRTFRPILPVDKAVVYPLGFHILGALPPILCGEGAVPTYRSASITGALAFWVFFIGAVGFTAQFSGLGAAAVGVTLSILLCTLPHYFVAYGAEPNVLAAGWLLMALSLLGSTGGTPTLPGSGFLRTLIAALFIAASLLTHPLPVLAGCYLLLPWVAAAGILGLKKNLEPAREILCLGLFSGLLALPYLLRAETSLSIREMFIVVKWHYEWGPPIAGPLSLLGDRLWRYGSQHLGAIWIFLAAVAFGYGGARFKKTTAVHLWLAAGIMVLTANSRYWRLPLSHALLPDRVLSLLVVPVAALTALAIKEGVDKLPAKVRPCLFAFLAFAAAVACQPWVTRSYFNPIIMGNVLTRDDLRLMGRMTGELSPDILIENSPNDAGIWIPAVAFRPVRLPLTNVAFFDEGALSWPKEPTYRYSGGRTLQVQPVNKVILQNLDLFRDPPAKAEIWGREGRATLFNLVPAPEWALPPGKGPAPAIKITAPPEDLRPASSLPARWEAAGVNTFNVQFAVSRTFEPNTIFFQSATVQPVTENFWTLEEIPVPPGFLSGKYPPLEVFLRVQGVQVERGRRIGPVAVSQTVRLWMK